MQNHVVICGFGRIGSLVGTALEAFSLPYLVVEVDPDIVKALRTRGVPCIFGNVAHASIIEHTHVAHARLVVITVPDKEPASAAIRSVRKLNPAVPIIARAHRMAERDDLLKDGATAVIQPEIEASAVLVSNALQYLPVSQSTAQAYVQTLRASLENKMPVAGPGDFPVVREITVGDFEEAGQTLAQTRVRERFGVTVVAISSPAGQIQVNPPAATSIKSGDTLRIFGLPSQLERFSAYVRAETTKTAT